MVIGQCNESVAHLEWHTGLFTKSHQVNELCPAAHGGRVISSSGWHDNFNVRQANFTVLFCLLSSLIVSIYFDSSAPRSHSKGFSPSQ